MKSTLIEKLRCPKTFEAEICGGMVILDESQVPTRFQSGRDELEEGVLCCQQSGTSYPAIGGVVILLDNIRSWLRKNYYHIISEAHSYK